MIKVFNLTLSWAEMVAPSVRHLAFEPPQREPFDFVPGQFITLHVPSDDKVLKRSYSVATIPHQSKLIEIAVSYVEGGQATKLLSNLQPGETVEATGPFGRLILRDEKPRRYILVATGTGVTPYRAMLPELGKRLEEDSDLEVIILFGARSRQEILYAKDFLKLQQKHSNFKFFACISREILNQPESHEVSGHVQVVLEKLQLEPHRDIIYLCGNPNMIDDSFNYLKEIGFNPQQVRREKYISTG